ncbi:MAG TPA: hypothetical protein VK447_13575, partial [Myxococcaceae bacterium]|nr:hypothetical protein [Myxococcaceae bacterium]
AQRYPEDPRTHYFAALAAFQKEDAPAAEAQLREALALVRSLKGRIDYQPEFEHVLRALLARSLLGQDQVEKAREAVLPICQRGPEGQLPEELEGIEQLCP